MATAIQITLILQHKGLFILETTSVVILTGMFLETFV